MYTNTNFISNKVNGNSFCDAAIDIYVDDICSPSDEYYIFKVNDEP